MITEELYIGIWACSCDVHVHGTCWRWSWDVNGMPIKLKEALFVNVNGLASNQSINQCVGTREAHQELSGEPWSMNTCVCVSLCPLAVCCWSFWRRHTQDPAFSSCCCWMRAGDWRREGREEIGELGMDYSRFPNLSIDHPTPAHPSPALPSEDRRWKLCQLKACYFSLYALPHVGDRRGF